LGSVYAVENDRLDAYHDAVRQVAEQRRAAEQRRRRCEQAARAAAELGIVLSPPPPDAMPAQLGPRPRIIVCDGAGSAIRVALAGGTGVLIVDERRLAWAAHVGAFYDLPTDRLLNALAA